MGEPSEKDYNQDAMGMFPILDHGIDDVDIPPERPCVSNWDIFFLSSSILMHIVDMLIDLNLATRYLMAKKIAYFLWTISLILLPSLINVIVSRRMKHQDEQRNRGFDPRPKKSIPTIARDSLYFLIAVVFQLAPVIHHYNTLGYALKAMKCKKTGDQVGKKRYFIKMLKEDEDVALLRVFECFLEAAPQQVFQISILLKHYNDPVNFEFFHQVLSIFSSLASMGWTMANYHRSIRLAQTDKRNIGIVGSILQFTWHFCVTVSRILSISVAASIWPVYTIVGCLCHWYIMTMWIVVESHGVLQFCRNSKPAPHTIPTCNERLASLLFAAVLGVVDVFIFLNVIDGKTFWKHMIFYTLCLGENLIAIISWIIKVPDELKDAWYFNGLVGGCIFPFILGSMAMILYYTAFHPSRQRPRLAPIPIQ